MNLQKIIEKQEELIKVKDKIINHYFNSPEMYLEEFSKKLDKLQTTSLKLESDLASLKAQEESNELTDLKQYVTNLLYYAHVEAMSMHSIDFDKWVEDHINNLDQYFAQSHQVEMPTNEIKKLTEEYIKSELPYANESFHYQAECASGVRDFSKWLCTEIKSKIK